VEGLAAFRQRALELAAPLSVHLELTYACNWRCVFCYNPRRFDLHRLSRADWSEVLDDLRSLGTLTVTLTGGEPLAHPEFLGIAEDVSSAMALGSSNGSLVDDELAPRLAST
jgi:MoaA/NifB/PqqE/SkfB family radical SAM enzyme